MLVNLFIVGAVKGGTTWLYEVLRSSNDVFCAELKEPQFFNPSYVSRKHIVAISSIESYQRRIAKADKEKIIVDGSATYLTTPDSPSLIKKYNPNAKIVIMLRDPVERAFSHYLMDMREGVTNSSFIKSDRTVDKKYINFSKYSQGVKKYLECFGDSNVLIISSNEMKSPERLIKKVCEFLEIKEFESLDVFLPKNPAAIPKNRVYQKILANESLRAFSGRVFSSKVRSKIKQMLVSSSDLPVLHEHEYLEVYNRYFQHEKEQINKLTGKEFW